MSALMGLLKIIPKWVYIVVAGLIVLGVIIYAYGEGRYQDGQDFVYNQVRTAKPDTVVVVDTLYLPPVKEAKRGILIPVVDGVEKAERIKHLEDSLGTKDSTIAYLSEPFYQEFTDKVIEWEKIMVDPITKIIERNVTYKPQELKTVMVSKTIVRDPTVWEYLTTYWYVPVITAILTFIAAK